MNNDEKIKKYLERFNKHESTKLDEDLPAFTAYLYRMMDNISIGGMSELYINTNDNQNKSVEYTKICKFLNEYLEHYSITNEIPRDSLNLEFINYGKTELVYVLTEKTTGKRVTLLVKQPAIPMGKVREEHDNLLELSTHDNMVVAPTDYFENEDQELYVTPYINQARCVASYSSWGMYIPEPIYRFEEFTPEQERLVNTCMIAKLISLYNPQTHEGIAQCRLGGGDFMLPKGWEDEIPTIENTLGNLYLISAREKIHCTLSEYENLIINEFTQRTIDQPNFKINHRGRVPMSMEDICNGIELGEKLLEERLNPSQV